MIFAACSTLVTLEIAPKSIPSKIATIPISNETALFDSSRLS